MKKKEKFDDTKVIVNHLVQWNGGSSGAIAYGYDGDDDDDVCRPTNIKLMIKKK